MAQQTAPASAASGANWSYYGKLGPSHWAKLDPSYAACARGKQQSPIDIRGAKVDPSLKPIEFHYLTGPVTMVNTGHTVRVDVAPGSYIIAGGTRYDLVEFHFHDPAEDLLDGKDADLGIDLLHKSASGEIAVIAVRMNEGNTDGVLAALWPSLPRTVGATTKIDEPINPAGLLPADRGYYAFTGSLTVPPCTEGVHWFVMKHTRESSGDQLAAYAALYPQSARPLQPLHGRKIGASQ